MEEQDGSYSVRSAYYGVMEDLIENTHLRKNGDWKTLWKIKVPPKMKLLMWRAARGVLPTHINLGKKMVNCDSSCPTSSGGEEDELHLFFDFTMAQEIWVHSAMQSEELQARGDVETFSACFFKTRSNLDLVVQQLIDSNIERWTKPRDGELKM